jgi:hypothetical protein
VGAQRPAASTWAAPQGAETDLGAPSDAGDARLDHLHGKDGRIGARRRKAAFLSKFREDRTSVEAVF